MGWTGSDSILLKNIWCYLINKTFKQLNAERAARRAQYKKAIDEEDWFTIEKIQKENKKKQEAASHKPQAPSAMKGTQLKGIIKNRVAQVLHSRNKLENHN